MSSACSTRSAIAPAGIAIGNITAPDDSTRRPLPLSSVSPIAEWPRPSRWPNLVRRHRLQVDAAGLAAGRRRPLEAGVEVDVRLEQRAGGRIEQERRRAEHPLLIGAIEEPERRAAVDLERLAAGEALGAEADRQFRQRVPGRRRPADRVGEGLGADAGDVALGHEVADRPGRPAHRHDLAARPRRRTSGRPRRAPAAPPGPRPARPPAARASAPSWPLLHGPHGCAEGGQRPARCGPAPPRTTRPGRRPSRTGVGTTSSAPDRGSARHAVDAERQPDRRRHRRRLAAQEHDHGVAGRERRRAGDDQPAAAGLAAGDAEGRGLGGRALEVLDSRRA